MSQRLSDIAADLARALRSSPDRCIRDYEMKVVSKCSRCKALEAYDAHVSIVQTPAGAAAEALRAAADHPGERHD